MIKDRTANLKGKIVEVEGIRYQLINGTLCRYADLTLDKGFKIVLGRTGSEGILKDLLNRLLGTNIVHLEYRSNEYPGMTEDDRASRFDVSCRDERGNGFLIEMQNWAQKYFNKRWLTKLACDINLLYFALGICSFTKKRYAVFFVVLQCSYDFSGYYLAGYNQRNSWRICPDVFF